MNIAVITAGGIGSRMKLEIPKQFFVVEGKPLILYTLQAFQSFKNVDLICVVFLEGYKEYFLDLISKYGLSKIKYLVPGGETNQLSIFNALSFLKNKISNDDIVLIHDGIRPLVDENVVNSNIDVCSKYGNAVAVIPSNEAMLYSENASTSSKSIARQFVWKTQTPHSMHFGDMFDLVSKTINRGIINSVAICTMLIEDNKKVFFSKGSNLNFKLTNPEDIDLFKGIIKSKK